METVIDKTDLLELPGSRSDTFDIGNSPTNDPSQDNNTGLDPHFIEILKKIAEDYDKNMGGSYNIGNNSSDVHNTITNPEDYFPLWTPDSNLTPEENLNSLTSWLDSLFTFYSMKGGYDYQYQNLNYANILQYAFAALSDMGPLADLSDSATVALAEKIADVSFNFINSSFQSALSYQSWYLQQEYNSPINQVNRLAQAGLCSSFALGNYNSGNAQQPASMPNIQQPSQSNAGSAQAQAESNKLGFIGQLVNTAASLIPGAAGAVSQLVASFATKKLTAKQIQLAESEIKNNAATFEVLRSQKDEIESNIGLRMFDSVYHASQQQVSQAGQRVEFAHKTYRNALDVGLGEVEMQGYRVNVRTKGGFTESRDITNSEFRNALDNNFTLSDGSTILLSENARGKISAELGAEMSFSASTGIPGIAGGSAGGKMSGKVAGELETSKGSQEGKSKSRSDSHSVSSSTSEGKQGYSSDGTSYSVGNTEFQSVTIRRKMPLPEHKAYIDSCLKDYQKALDEYNTLSTGEKARLLDLLDLLGRNLSSFNSRLIHSLYMDKVNNLFAPKPIVGD